MTTREIDPAVGRDIRVGLHRAGSVVSALATVREPSHHTTTPAMAVTDFAETRRPTHTTAGAR